MQFTAEQIAKILEGTVEGDSQVAISEFSKIEEGKQGGLSFLSNPKYEHFIYETHASAVVVNEDFVPTKPTRTTLIRVKNAYSAFTKLLQLYQALTLDKSGVEEPSYIDKDVQINDTHYIGAFAYIGKGVKLGDNVKVYPHVYIGDNVEVGEDVMLFPGVKIYADCKIGNRVVVHSGAVIGSDGFGFAPQENGSYTKIPQIGNVIIEDDVEIGANTVVDRATMGSTVIRQGVKLDNLIQIAHNAEVGKNTVIAAQTGISGSSKIGENVIIGGQVGVVGHISIADGSQVQAQSGINKSLKEEGKKWGGTPVMPFNSQLRSHVFYGRLPEMEKRLLELEKKIKQLEQED